MLQIALVTKVPGSAPAVMIVSFQDRYAWANSVDPDQTVPGGAV